MLEEIRTAQISLFDSVALDYDREGLFSQRVEVNNCHSFVTSELLNNVRTVIKSTIIDRISLKVKAVFLSCLFIVDSGSNTVHSLLYL